ncbi:probable sarcosine oxidase [Magnolia sinica]|uniref:probable sarcosine oxidase n=1 Tax=Magnolia sinica TaxID=86752 RepID=UPI00265B01C7|nr:probable sarcosine oxidase [Magnolia sinica]
MENHSEQQFDVIVVGAGIMGSCAAYQLAKRGQKTLLIEQFDFLHHRGSSHGESRTLRAAYSKDYYPSMVLESIRLWEEAESEIRYKVYTKTPHLNMASSDNPSLQSVIASCRSNSIPHQILNRQQVADQFKGMFNLPDDWIGLVTEIGGVIRPTKAMSMFQTLAIRCGAVLRDNMEVKEIKRDEEKGGIWVSAGGTHRFWARKCVVTVGAWMGKLVKMVTGMELPIQPLHITICYWRIKEESTEPDFSPESNFPTFSSYGEPHIYGTPSVEFPGLIKITVDGGYPCDPDRRTWAAATGSDGNAVAAWIDQVFGGRVESAGGPVVTQPCMYSMTPDHDYIIDFLGGEFGKDVVVAGGFSGHGFKMGPVVGRILADLVINGEADGVDLSHFMLGRFEAHLKGDVKEN